MWREQGVGSGEKEPTDSAASTRASTATSPCATSPSWPRNAATRRRPGGSGGWSSTPARATPRPWRAVTLRSESRSLPPGSVSPTPSASAREVSRDTANPAPTMKQPWVAPTNPLTLLDGRCLMHPAYRPETWPLPENDQQTTMSTPTKTSPSQLPDYIASAKPNPLSNRAPWFKNTAPTYAGIFLWFIFWDSIAGKALMAAGLGATLLGILLAGLICHFLFYLVPGLLGRKTGPVRVGRHRHNREHYPRSNESRRRPAKRVRHHRASFGPICGAMAADYLLAGKRWSGPRAGFNPAGWVAWALGFLVGILPNLHGRFPAIPDVPAAPVAAFIVGFAVYFACAKIGLISPVISMPNRADVS